MYSSPILPTEFCSPDCDEEEISADDFDNVDFYNDAGKSTGEDLVVCREKKLFRHRVKFIF